MITQYVQGAMKRATYEVLPDGTFYGEIPGFRGVLANAPTLEECREELLEVLEGWIILGSVDIHCHSERSEESKDLALPATILDSSLRSVQNLHSLVKAT